MQPDRAITSFPRQTVTTPGLEAAICCILDAVNKTEDVLNHLWQSVKDQYIASNIQEPFPAFIQRRISRFDLITILRAVFAQTWDKIQQTQGKREISRLRSAASRFGLQDDFELFLWFGSAVKSQRTWRIVAAQKELPSARDLHLKLEASCRRRLPYLHPLQLEFQPKDFEQALQQHNSMFAIEPEFHLSAANILASVEQSQAPSRAIEATKLPGTSTDSDKEPNTFLATVNTTSQATANCTAKVTSRQVTPETPSNSPTRDQDSAPPPPTETDLNASTLLLSLSKSNMAISDCDDSAIGLLDQSPEISGDEESTNTNQLDRKNTVSGGKKNKSVHFLKESVVVTTLRDIRLEFEGSQKKVDALKIQHHNDAEAYTVAMKKHKEAIVADLDAMEMAPHTVAPNSIDGHEKKFRHAAGQKRKALDAVDDLTAKKARMDTHLDAMYAQIDEAMALYARRVQEEMEGVGDNEDL
ncbi:hypothetical protein K4K48_012106 [Colletotrichum sp. SAR 10_66]|nr:hypothetical protein K4K48_012106 [Colletotrichum sp. SAR 10_66]